MSDLEKIPERTVIGSCYNYLFGETVIVSLASDIYRKVEGIFLDTLPTSSHVIKKRDPSSNIPIIDRLGEKSLLGDVPHIVLAQVYRYPLWDAPSDVVSSDVSAYEAIAISDIKRLTTTVKKNQYQSMKDTGFRTDAEISGPTADKYRVLQEWKAEDAEVGGDELHWNPTNNDGAGDWDQFTGQGTTYNEDIYTTHLDMSKHSRDALRQAGLLADEIEKKGRRTGIDNGRDYSDEEGKFGAVAGTGAYKDYGKSDHNVNLTWQRGQKVAPKREEGTAKEAPVKKESPPCDSIAKAPPADTLSTTTVTKDPIININAVRSNMGRQLQVSRPGMVQEKRRPNMPSKGHGGHGGTISQGDWERRKENILRKYNDVMKDMTNIMLVYPSLNFPLANYSEPLIQRYIYKELTESMRPITAVGRLVKEQRKKIQYDSPKLHECTTTNPNCPLFDEEDGISPEDEKVFRDQLGTDKLLKMGACTVQENDSWRDPYGRIPEEMQGSPIPQSAPLPMHSAMSTGSHYNFMPGGIPGGMAPSMPGSMPGGMAGSIHGGMPNTVGIYVIQAPNAKGVMAPVLAFPANNNPFNMPVNLLSQMPGQHNHQMMHPQMMNMDGIGKFSSHTC